MTKLGHPLTGRELDVLVVMSYGRTQEEGATELAVTLQTLKNHLSAVYEKTGSRNLVGAYRRLGWLNIPDIDLLRGTED